MAVALRSQGATVAVSGSSTLVLNVPAGVQSGDYLIAFIHNQNSGATVDTSCSGWTRINAAFIPSDYGSRVTGMYAKVATGSEPASYTFAVSSGGRSVGFIAAYSGVDTASPIYYASTYTKGVSSSTTLNISADATAADHFTIEQWAANYTASNSYALSSYTGGLTLLGSGYCPAGTENTTVSRSAMMVWQGTTGSSGMPAHVVTTVGAAAQMCVSMVCLVPLGSGGGGTITTPTIVGHTTAQTTGAASTITLNPETNRVGFSSATNDWIILILTSAATSSGTRQPTPSAGWTNIVPFGTVGSGTMTFGVWAHKKASGESSYTWTQTTAEANNTISRMIFVRGADDIAHWITGTFQNRATSATTLTNIAPSVTAVTDHTLALLISAERTTATETDSQVTCDNFTKDWFDNVYDSTIFVANKDMVTAGATGSVTVTYPNSHSQNGVAGILAIPGTVSTSIGLPIKVSNGTNLTDATFQLANGAGGLTVPGAYKTVRPGYSSVTQMLSQTMFYCAHRGGSLDFPEMSLYAYGQSALLGYPALELSLARTADGVWFGLHDATLDRTSGVSGVDPSTLTWSQVQSYQILGTVATNNPSQSNRPYMRWEEIMSLYYNTHVLFVDPKVAINYRTELLNMMDAMPGTPTTHFVAKYYGVSGGASNTSGWNFDAKARGYKTWGYFYESDSANYATYAPRWDILGMDYSASQSAWNSLAAAAPGKPIMGHICPNQAAATTAISKGAVGLMVSGVKAVSPGQIT